MSRTSSSEIADRGEGTIDSVHNSIRDRFPFKRNAKSQETNIANLTRRRVGRQHALRPPRKFFKSSVLFYFIAVFTFGAFVLASVILQSSITAVFRGGGDTRVLLRREFTFGTSLKFLPPGIFAKDSNLDQSRAEARIALRSPKLAVILGSLRGSPQLLMMCTLLKNLRELGYTQAIYALEDGDAHSVFRKMGYHVSFLMRERLNRVDWLRFEGIIADSLEAREAISSFMQEPFISVPLIWIIHETTLADRMPHYVEKKWEELIYSWKSAFSRANFVVFSDYSLPMLYGSLDGGNFFVVPASPADVCNAEEFQQTHSRHQLRADDGFRENDILVPVIGSSFFFRDLSCDYAVAMHSIGPLLVKYARRNDGMPSVHFLFLCGNSSSERESALQELSQRLGLPNDYMKHYDIDSDVDRVLLMADIVLYASFQEELGFPPFLARAMSFGAPIVAPDYPIMKKYIVNRVHGITFPEKNPDALTMAFSHLISDGKVSKSGRALASSARLLVKNMLAYDYVTSYAGLLERVLEFPSNVRLPHPISHLHRITWEWNMLDAANVSYKPEGSGVVSYLEKKFGDENGRNETETLGGLNPITRLDWDVLRDMELSEDHQRRETEEIDERTEKSLNTWEEVYQRARKADKARFERNERDGGELERTGQSLCIYEIYTGPGTWPFLHNGSLYRGLSLSGSDGRRMTSDDVDAVERLPLLNESCYRDLLCEHGAMFSVANRVDTLHKTPWIGFQSWRATAQEHALSSNGEKAIEEAIGMDGSRNGAVYFWAWLDGGGGTDSRLPFWSTCDALNAGRCRTAFEQAFRRMYALPPDAPALPPMPDDGELWSALHSWAMPTPSFLEFIMFSRMFVDSLDAVRVEWANVTRCLLGYGATEGRQCYCRLAEVLVNVWAYHSGRRMVYVDPVSGHAREQHTQRGFVWRKYFSRSLLKSMDEDLAEAADDEDNLRIDWLWPRTGEVHWQGIYEREREERYRLKMEKKRIVKARLIDRMQHGYRQKSLAQ